MPHPRIEAAIVAMIGLVIVLGGIGGYIADRDLSARGVTTTAKVVSAYPGKDSTYDVQFSLPNRHVVTERTSYASNGASVGDTISVEYDPEDPTTVAESGTRSTAWILWGGWVLTGIGGLLYSVRLWLRRRSAGPV